MVITSKSYIYARTKALAKTLDMDTDQFLSYRFSTKYYWTYIYFNLRKQAVARMMERNRVLKRLPSELEDLIKRFVGVPYLMDPEDNCTYDSYKFVFGIPPLWFIASQGLWTAGADVYQVEGDEDNTVTDLITIHDWHAGGVVEVGTV